MQPLHALAAVIILVLIWCLVMRPAPGKSAAAELREHVENLDERLVKYLGYAQEMAPTNTGIKYHGAT